jgi:hypothetical protein
VLSGQELDFALWNTWCPNRCGHDLQCSPNDVVPEAMAFRIFQDMRGVQAVYRITPATNHNSADTIIWHKTMT